MSRRISLARLIHLTQKMFNGSEIYINERTGKVLIFSKEVIQAIEEEREFDDYPEWQQRQIKRAEWFFAKEAKYSVFMPSSVKLENYPLMQEFCSGIEDKSLSNKLRQLIHGKGAFKRFREAIVEHGIEYDWYSYRRQAYKKNAIAWLEKHCIAYKDDLKPIKKCHKKPQDQQEDQTRQDQQGDESPQDQQEDQTPQDQQEDQTPSDQQGDQTPSDQQEDQTSQDQQADQNPSE